MGYLKRAYRKEFTQMKIPQGIGKDLRVKRVLAGISQTELALILGTDQTQVSRWEQSHVFPANYLERVREFLAADPALLNLSIRMSKRRIAILRALKNRKGEN